MNPRIAYLVSRYPAISHTFILREVLALRRRGFEIHTASINLPDRPADKLTAEERAEAEATLFIKSAGLGRVCKALLATFAASPVRFFSVFGYALGLSGLNLRASAYNLFYLVEAMVLADWMRSKRLSHVHVHFATPAATVALIASRFAGIEFSMTVHGPDEFYNVDAYHLAEKVRRAKFVCCISQFCRSQLMKVSAPQHWDKLDVSPLGVNPDHFRPVPHQFSFEFRLLCVGRLVAAKGQAVLLQALHRLVQEHREVSLTLVGDGPDRPMLQALAERLAITRHVRFAGAVNQDAIRDFYLNADAFVLPSFAEGVPVVLMEAMAMEMPCISTRITGIPELITTSHDGILVSASDEKTLAEAIALLEDSPTVAQRLGSNGRRKVLADYNLEKNVDRLAEIFRSRLSEPVAAPLLEGACA